MKPGSANKVFVIVLCVLALFAAQTFGSKAAFYCMCGGKPVLTETPHCYGPHGSQCHASGATTGDSHGDEGSGARKDHQVVSQDVQSHLPKAAVEVDAPQILYTLQQLVEVFFASYEVTTPVSIFVEFGESPPSGVTVARTIVLLI